ncbi:MAG: RNA-binding S4 domain-containing protein, partial [Muribaculaceae bacterium]|nr:RNA-binding S4 domain-containing protein [Muribaculaceae bacterium]
QGGYNNRQQGGYQRHAFNTLPQGGYNNRQGGYNNRYNNYGQGGYNRPQRDYTPTPETEDGATTTAVEGNDENNTNTGYTPRYQRPQGGYNNRQQHGGYNNRQGGYNNRQGGYNNRQQQGGYNNRQGGYNNRQGGYNNRQQQGGYNNRYNTNGGYGNRQQQGGYNNRQQPGKSFVPRPKRVEYEMPIPDPNEQIRLNKFMANAGICSRREADEYITKGEVTVNGNVVTELGTKIGHSDVVEFNGKVVTLESKCYILLNKPKDCVTTSDDPNGRMTVMDIVKNACQERIYPVGRLDRNTTGVLLLTNDGDLASKLTHPKYVKKKIYHVWTDKDITEEDMQRIADGIELEDGPIHADAISYATDTDRNQAGIEIHSGRNRIVRRIFESLGYHVTKLDRVYFAGLTKKNLPRGRWRYLTQEEVNFLKMGSFE